MSETQGEARHPGAPSTGARRVGPLVAWAIVLAAVLPLLPTLRAAFVYDDTAIIRENAMLRGWGALARVWSAS